MRGPVPIGFDVTAALPPEAAEGERITISGWLFLPDDPAVLGAHPVTMVLVAGGS